MDYETVNKLALERGFYSPSCEIYGDSQAGFWDYGPLGLGLRNKYLDQVSLMEIVFLLP